jgi:hypothetical protein
MAVPWAWATKISKVFSNSRAPGTRRRDGLYVGRVLTTTQGKKENSHNGETKQHRGEHTQKKNTRSDVSKKLDLARRICGAARVVEVMWINIKNCRHRQGPKKRESGLWCCGLLGKKWGGGFTTLTVDSPPN